MGMVGVNCPNCGANIELDESREFGFCSYCGTKVIQDKVVIEHRGSVSIDKDEEFKNLISIARKNKNTGNYKQAFEHYKKAQIINPDDWEPAFYCMLFDTDYNPKSSPLNSDTAVYRLAKSIIESLMKSDKSDAYKQSKIEDMKNWILKVRGKYITGASIMSCWAKAIDDLLDEKYKAVSIRLWEKAAEIYKSEKYSMEYNLCAEKINEYYGKIVRKPKKQACYVATAVYGSYDGPQVWTLRRYRDYHLVHTWYGKAFIHIYYAISPTIVKWFGETKWFKRMWLRKLDKMVEKLQLNGFESTPYNDLEL